MLMGCQSSIPLKKVNLPATNPQARTSCGELELYKTGTKAEILRISTDTAIKFHKCKAKQETLVKEYKNLEDAVKKFNKGL